MATTLLVKSHSHSHMIKSFNKEGEITNGLIRGALSDALMYVCMYSMYDLSIENAK